MCVAAGEFADEETKVSGLYAPDLKGDGEFGSCCMITRFNL